MTHKGLLEELRARLWAIKPGTGLAVADPWDKTRWTLEFRPGTTEAEKVALQKVIDDCELQFVQAEQ